MNAQKSERFELRLEPEFIETIDTWRAGEPDLPTRAEALRRLATIGLNTQTTRQAFMAIKFQILVASLTEGPGARLDDAYVFAWDRDLYPWFHDSAGWHLPFKDDFDISHDRMGELMTFLDKKWLEGTAIPTFYELEEQFRDRGWDRSALIKSCRYAFLSDRFDNRLWHRLMKRMEYPSEAGSITDPFDRAQAVYLM